MKGLYYWCLIFFSHFESSTKCPLTNEGIFFVCGDCLARQTQFLYFNICSMFNTIMFTTLLWLSTDYYNKQTKKE